jgi:hypothetical protein
MAKKETTSTSLVQFGDFTADEASEMKRESEAASGGGIIFKLKPGRTVVRPIPPKKGEKLMKVAYVHYLDVPGTGRVSFNCPRLMAKRACSVCATETKLLATGEDNDFKKAKKLKAKRQLYMNMIVRGDEGVGPRVLRFGKMIEDQLIEIRQDEDDGGNFSHPTAGFDLKISRKGEGQNDTEYKVVASGARPSPLAADAAQMQEWIDNQPDLSRFLRVMSDEQIERKLNGEEGGGSDDDAPRRRPAIEATASTSKPRSRSIESEVDAIEVDDE